jgi:glycosyltransferase involved in cell wall biosynthesis
MPFFSVLMPTRNRPALFAAALASVLAQQGADFEVVVVDDGSDDAALAGYAALSDLADDRVRRVLLERTLRGHGPSFVINHAAMLARGTYLAFLDDDDAWTDPHYLARAAAALEGGSVEMHYANQRLFIDGQVQARTVWIEDLAPRLGLAATAPVTPAQLLGAHGFCHINATIARRDFFLGLGGFDNQIGYEGDRDLWLRALDAATSILHDPAFVARHNAPDPAAQANASTAESLLLRRISQLRVLDKAIALARRAEVQAYARRHKGFVLKRMARELAEAGDTRRAAFYAREALGVAPGVKWLGYAVMLGIRK